MKCVRFLCFGITMCSMVAYAGQRLGNGGDAVYCPDPGPFQVRLLDVWEAESIYGFENRLGDYGTNVETIVNGAINQLESRDPLRAEVLRRNYNEYQKTHRIGSYNLTDIPDSQHVALPSGCEIRQIAVQLEDPAPGQPRYLIDENLWNLLDPANQAALVLHEIIYRDALLHGHEDSRQVRALNVQIISKNLYNLSYPESINFLNGTAMSISNIIRIQGNDVHVNPRNLDNGTEFKGTLIKVGVFNQGATTVKFQRPRIKASFYSDTGFVSSVEWYQNASKSPISAAVTLPNGGILTGAAVSFYPSGDPIMVGQLNDIEITAYQELDEEVRSMIFQKNDLVRLSSRRYISSGEFKTPTPFSPNAACQSFDVTEFSVDGIPSLRVKYTSDLNYVETCLRSPKGGFQKVRSLAHTEDGNFFWYNQDINLWILDKITLDSAQAIEIPNQAKRATFLGSVKLNRRTGFVEKGTLLRRVTLVNDQGEEVEYRPGQELYFNADGFVSN